MRDSEFYKNIITREEKCKFTREQNKNLTKGEKAIKNFYQNQFYVKGAPELFDKMMRELKRKPSLNEYMKRYCKLAYDQLKQQEIVQNASENEIKVLQQAIVWRSELCYKAKFAEDYFIHRLEEVYDDIEIYEDILVDKIFGVDIVAEIEGKWHYIHVTKNTESAIKKINKKEKQIMFTFNRKRFDYMREFKHHDTVTYDVYNFKNWTREDFDKALKEANDDSLQLQNFIHRMKKKKIVGEDYQLVSRNGKIFEVY